jgi:hypothetical protein
MDARAAVRRVFLSPTRLEERGDNFSAVAVDDYLVTLEFVQHF